MDRTPTHFRAYNAAGHVVEEGALVEGKARVTDAAATKITVLGGGEGESEFALFQNAINGPDTYTPVAPPPEPKPVVVEEKIVSAAGSASAVGGTTGKAEA